jgi:hypothetical protein
MLNILLSTLDPMVPTPDTSQMATARALPLTLWSVTERDELCNLRTHKTGLHTILCSFLHPSYTFSEQTVGYPDQVVSAVRAAVREVAFSELFDEQKSSVVECYASAAWRDTQALLRHYGGQCGGGPCDNASLFTFEDKRNFSLKELGDTRNGYYLASFLRSSTQSISNQAPSLANRVDYVSGGSAAVAQVWGVDTSLFEGFVDTLGWATHACAVSMPEEFCAPPQSSMRPEDPCLFEDQYQDADRHFQAKAPEITILFSDQTTVMVPVCPLLSSTGSQFIYQTDYGFTEEDERSNLVPMIQEVLAPPGVYLNAYTGPGTLKDWNKAVPAQMAIACALSPVQQSSWWPTAAGASTSSLYDEVWVDFTKMLDWWPGSQIGCGQYDAVIAVEYRLESSFVSQTASAHCNVMASLGGAPMSVNCFELRKPANCGYDMLGNRQRRAFRVRENSTSGSQQVPFFCAFPSPISDTSCRACGAAPPAPNTSARRCMTAACSSAPCPEAGPSARSSQMPCWSRRSPSSMTRGCWARCWADSPLRGRCSRSTRALLSLC